ncbi:gamma-interferon-inducible lysosomal thiol reductase [Forsythia ovata]|uniref:Gamma-interferon-inducible lysosomal thiol reductase n=1 Tax=Forsythia ovata TaxID=205694 RepID=A0ABD1X5H6_9LAMI
MESHRRLIPFLSLGNHLWILLIISCLFVNHCSGSSINGGGSEKEKVTLELYYESLCPYCSNLIVNYLYKLFDSGVIAITQLKLVPYGNAKIRANGTITCQDYRNFISYICKAYNGTSVPSVCSESSVGVILASLPYRTNN